jgi:FkbM family methyltransferase
MAKLIRRIRPLIGRVLKAHRQWKYSRKVFRGDPIEFTLARGINFYLYPWGQITRLLYISGFEETELNLTRSYLMEGMNVVDVGANIGLYSILAAKVIGESGRVWAFEPSSETYECLVKNLSINNISSVIPNKLALSDITDSKILLQRPCGRGDAERYLVSDPGNPSPYHEHTADPGDSELVRITSMDSYMEEKHCNMRVDFIKVDVEGGEYAVLRGAQKLLRSNPDILLMFECAPALYLQAGYKVDDIFNFLRNLGFELFLWSRKKCKWESDQGLLSRGGSIWACRDKKQLPELKI